VYRFWDSLVEPILARLEPRVIVEIGSEAGRNTRNLLAFCETRGAVLHSIDPEPAFDTDGLESAFPDRFVFHRAPSLEALPAIESADAVLIDGDHNWYTTLHELLLLERIAAEAGRPYPLVLAHDIGWPYARRDVYYRPEDIPPVFRNDFARRGLVPWSEALVDHGGMNDALANATAEGGAHNGVLTAVEDFLTTTAAPVELSTVPGYHGLGVICARPLLDSNSALRELLDDLRAARVLETHIASLEQDRIRGRLDVDALRRQSHDLESRLGAAAGERQHLDAQLAALDARIDDAMSERQRLEAELGATRGERAELRRKVPELHRQKQALEAEVATLRAQNRTRGEELQRRSVENADLREEIQLLGEVLTAENARLEALQRDHESERVRLVTELRRLSGAGERRIADLESALRRLTEERKGGVAQLQAELDRAAAAHAAERARLREEIRQLGQELIRGNRLRRTSQLLSWILRRPSRKRFRLVREYARLRRSGAFDPAFYVGAYPDVARARMDPLMHYVEHGASEGRDPSPEFDTTAYVEAHPELAQAGANPLLHRLESKVAALASLDAPREAPGGVSPDEPVAETDRGNGGLYLDTKRLHERRLTLTAVIPSYNHARFLERRVESIMRQTHHPDEVIILDDGSTDGSRALIERLAKTIELPVTTVFNEENSGSVFAQWQAGISLAAGDLIWICESDDSCEDTFLSSLTPYFADPSIMLAFGKIRFADSDDVADSRLEDALEEVAPGYWTKRVESAFEWFRGPFGLLNAIPNAGGCVFRRQELAPEVWEEARRYAVCGDWYLYMQLARGGRIAFDPAAVSYFRQHGENTSVSHFKNLTFYEEHYRIARELRRTYGTLDAQLSRFYARVADHYERNCDAGRQSGLREVFPLQEVIAEQRQRRHIMVGLLGFKTGGGELFPINLANELVDRGHNVSLVVLDGENENPDIRALVRREIPIYERALVEEIGLRRFLATHGVDLIHTHFLGVDLWLHEAARDLGIPYVVTLHGSYEVGGLDRARTVALLDAVGEWVYTAEKNLAVFDGCERNGSTFTKLPNAVPPSDARFELTRLDLGVPEDAVVFGLASRALRSKGWDIAVEALERLSTSTGRPIHLILCGDGPDYAELTEQYGQAPNVSFLGYQSAIIDFYRLCDCCILPTRFPGESLPFTLIESLQAGTPLIATDLGGIPELLGSGESSAGILVPNLDDDEAFTAAVAEAMEQMLDDDRRSVYAETARRLAPQYSFPRLVSEYEAIYNRAGGWLAD
jgi:glycosyltransferase involved in cell wall biosynthesis